MAEQITRPKGGLAETIRVVVQALLIALVIRTLLFQPFIIPSSSMKNTLLVGDYVFVSKYAYGYSHASLPFAPPLFSGRVFGSEPKRGDVVVFSNARDQDKDYIKRLIGMPGDKIQMLNGVLFINGVAVPKEFAGDVYDPKERSQNGVLRRYKETLPNGVSYYVLDGEPQGPLDTTGVYTVPPGHYFMMGDNRDNSSDSRVASMVGFVPHDKLVGRAEIIWLSVNENYSLWQFWYWPWSLRFNRMFTSLRV